MTDDEGSRTDDKQTPNHGTAFKAKVGLEAMYEQQTLSELAEHFQVKKGSPSGGKIPRH